MENLFGKYLRNKREESNLSVRELARASKISPTFISKLELGKVLPTEKIIMRISNIVRLDFIEAMFYARRLPKKFLDDLFIDFNLYRNFVDSSTVDNGKT